MKGDKTVIEQLNQVLKNELTAINQYFLHAKMLQDWGYSSLYKKVYEESIDEMKHANKVIERILFLEGLPNLQSLAKLRIGTNPKEQFECDLKLEHDAIPALKKGISACLDSGDHTTRELFEQILEDEEAHVDWLESQLHLISEVGEQNYLAGKID